MILEKKQSYQVLGIDISPYSKDEFFSLVDARLQDDNPESPAFFVVTVNPEIVIQSIIDNDFKRILGSSSINTADGVGISWAVNYLYGMHIDRITGSDSLEKICTQCASHNASVFFYGAMPTIADRAASILQDRIQELIVAGTYSPDSPDIKLEDLPHETQQNLKKADVVFVALGAPAQEKWINQNLPKLSACKLIIGIGGSFDFVVGNVKRAPKWLCKSGLEWLYRLWLQPSRWRRMLKLPLFALNIMLLRISNPDLVKLRQENR
ncbi:WecB/TagA/CpsF family glycosyltransferase [Fodinibius sp. AD559]|uniref:WecB/TagA/CpsF family glycosyltransferase n=1 Tax=Fodinibius sp. AD559 TaxID=3424179 RepID=UPI004046E48F